MERSLPQLEDVFWAVADEVRGQILTMLRGNEMCACKILEHFDMRQPTLSHHMKILCDAQLVTSRRDGRWVRYRLNQPVIQELIDALAALQEEKAPVLPPPMGGKAVCAHRFSRLGKNHPAPAAAHRSGRTPGGCHPE